RTAAPAPTASPTPRRTRSPRVHRSTTPAVTSTGVASTAHPVAATQDVGSIALPSDRPSAAASPVAARAAASTGSSDKLTKLITLVVSAALLLGLGGAAGLYLTRHP
ncbi:MAG: hypothetical protein WCD35_03185, partial [Mycobacteriales bacterium]